MLSILFSIASQSISHPPVKSCPSTRRVTFKQAASWHHYNHLCVFLVARRNINMWKPRVPVNVFDLWPLLCAWQTTAKYSCVGGNPNPRLVLTSDSGADQPSRVYPESPWVTSDLFLTANDFSAVWPVWNNADNTFTSVYLSYNVNLKDFIKLKIIVKWEVNKEKIIILTFPYI